MQMVLDGILTGTQALFIGYAMCKTVKIRNPRLYTFLITTVITLIFLLRLYIIPQYNSPLILASVAMYHIITLFFTAGKRATAHFCLGSYQICHLFCDLALSVFMSLFVSNIAELIYVDMRAYLMLKVIIILPIALATYIMYRILCRLLRKSAAFVKLSSVLLLPVSQVSLMAVFLLSMQSQASDGPLSMVFFITSLVCVVSDIFFFLALLQIRENEQLRESIRAAEYESSVQEGYHEMLEQNMTAVNRIRHDITNQMQVACSLYYNGERETALGQLDQIHHILDRCTEYVYCSNSIVDAVLVDKAALLQSKGIEPLISIQLPQQLEISDERLCRAFAGIIDCALGIAAQESGQIRVSACVSGGRLDIACELSSSSSGGIDDTLTELAAFCDGAASCSPSGSGGSRFVLTLPLPEHAA